MKKRGISPTIVITFLVALLLLFVVYSLYQNKDVAEETNDSLQEAQPIDNDVIEEPKNYLGCVDYQCVLMNGSGRDHPDCSAEGQACEIAELCGNGICDAGKESTQLCAEDCTGEDADVTVKQPIEIKQINDGVLITAEIQNIGGKETKIFRNRISLRNENFDSLSNTLKPGQAIEKTEFISLVSGEYEVLVWVDLDNDIDESNEENNIITQTFTVE